jgi:large subunit ribosomal protein L2
MRIFSFFKKNLGGRNNTGRTTVRHRGAPTVKRKIFNFFNYAVVTRRKYRFLPPTNSPFHTVCYKQGNSYCISAFSSRFSFKSSSFKPNSYSEEFCVSKLYTIPMGTFVYNIQNHLGSNTPTFGRAPGSQAQLLKRRGSFATIKLPSGEIRRVNARCYAMSAAVFRQFVKPVYYKAGQLRNLGIRPHVRGCAINPVDHPHGGRTGESRPSVSPWAQLTKGFRTRTKVINSRLVLTSVQSLKSAKAYK